MKKSEQFGTKANKRLNIPNKAIDKIKIDQGLYLLENSF